MNKHYKLRIIFIFLAIGVLFLPPFVNARSNLLPGQVTREIKESYKRFSGDEDLAKRDPRHFIVSIIKATLSLLAIILLVMLTYAGYRYMTAGGDEEVIKEALVTIRNAVIGLLIIFSAYAITVFVVKVVFSPTSDIPEYRAAKSLFE